jgi:hypothetical protein
VAPEATCGRGLAPCAHGQEDYFASSFSTLSVMSMRLLAYTASWKTMSYFSAFGDLADHLVGAFQDHGQFLVAALVQVFTEFALLALEFLVQVGQVTLALGAV